MTGLPDLDVSLVGLFWALAAGLLLVLLLRAVRPLATAVERHSTWRRTLARLWPLGEAVLVAGWAVVALALMFPERVYHTMALLALLLVAGAWLSWFVARDWFAGLLLRLRGELRVGALLSLDDVRGTIRTIGSTALVVESDGGQRVTVPYGRLLGAVRGGMDPDGGSRPRHAVTVVLPDTLDPEAARALLLEAALTAPAAWPDAEPRVEWTGSGAAWRVETRLVRPGMENELEADIRRQLAHAGDGGPPADRPAKSSV